MGRVLRGVSISLAILVGLPLVALGIYDFAVVRPAVPEVRRLVAASHPDERAVPAEVAHFIVASHTSTRAAEARAATLALWRLEGLTANSLWRRLVYEPLWSFLLPYHLSRSEALALYASLSFNGTDHGLSRLAERRFGAPLSKLSRQQAAEAVAILWSPLYLARSPERLAVRTQWLLARSGHEP